VAQESVFTVTFVCTGNRARSPVAQELLLRLVADSDVSVDSYGTLDLGPVPALPEAQAAALPFGIDLQSHRARPLRPGALADVDLVVGFEPTHVATAVVDGGVARERCFTIMELAEVLGAEPGPVDGVSPARSVERAHARRSGSPLSAPSVPDPLGGTPADFRTMVETVDRLVAIIARGVFGAAVDIPNPRPRPGGWRGLLERIRSG
jgi:protein-tyrosine phosphatase